MIRLTSERNNGAFKTSYALEPEQLKEKSKNEHSSLGETVDLSLTVGLARSVF